MEGGKRAGGRRQEAGGRARWSRLRTGKLEGNICQQSQCHIWARVQGRAAGDRQEVLANG